MGLKRRITKLIRADHSLYPLVHDALLSGFVFKPYIYHTCTTGIYAPIFVYWTWIFPEANGLYSQQLCIWLHAVYHCSLKKAMLYYCCTQMFKHSCIYM